MFTIQFNPGLNQAPKNEQTNVNRNIEVNFLEIMQGMKEQVSNLVFVPGSNESSLFNFLKRQEVEKPMDKGAKWVTIYDLIAEIERFERDERNQR